MIRRYNPEYTEALFSNSHHQFLPYNNQPFISQSQTNNNNNEKPSSNSRKDNESNNKYKPPLEKEISNQDMDKGNTSPVATDNTRGDEKERIEEKEKSIIKLRVVSLLRQWIVRFWDIFQEDDQLRRLLKTLMWIHIHYRMGVADNDNNNNNNNESSENIIRERRLMMAITRSIVESKVSQWYILFIALLPNQQLFDIDNIF